MDEFMEQLKACGWELPLDGAKTALLTDYVQMLVEWNQKINLTAITDPREIEVKHFLDSLSLLAFVPPVQRAAVLDVGSGAGFPGMVLKVARPDLQLTCMDGTQKRVGFLSALVEKLQLTDTVCLHARAEEAGRAPSLREHFDYVTARAVANLRALCEYCLPFVKLGGRFVAMKGPDGEAEAADAKNAIETLGGKIENIYAFTLPSTDFSRTLVEIKKERATPSAYPRPAGKMKKKPL